MFLLIPRERSRGFKVKGNKKAKQIYDNIEVSFYSTSAKQISLKKINISEYNSSPVISALVYPTLGNTSFNNENSKGMSSATSLGTIVSHTDCIRMSCSGRDSAMDASSGTSVPRSTRFSYKHNKTHFLFIYMDKNTILQFKIILQNTFHIFYLLL